MNPPTNLQDLQELKTRLLQGVRTVKPHATQCLEGTRTSILADLDVKTTNCDGANIIHIYGAPGSGKSSISLTAKSRLQRQRQLVTYFRFDRNDAATTTPTSLWCHVAYDLARLFPSVLSQLLQQLRNDEVNLDSPMDIFTSFVEDALSNIASPIDRPLVVIIDALDECGGLTGRLSSDRQILLQTIRRWAKLPKHFKLLVTSRQEGDITRVLSSISTPIEIPSGHFITENPKLRASINSSNDIRMYLEDRFQRIRERLSLLPTDWPGTETMGGMVHRAAGIFMWATTAANFIDSGMDPSERLRRIMEGGSGSSTMKPLYSLYSIVLEIGFGEISGSDPDAEILQSVLGTMVLAKRPLVDIEYTKLPTPTPLTQIKLDSIRDGLRSVIAPGNLRFVHKSFDDFLLSEECPPKYAVRKDKSHYLLTQLCLTTMREGLRFNMCSLETSCLRNTDVPDIANKLANGIPSLLSYSCLFFAEHLGLIPFDEHLGKQVEEMMLDKLLFWFEAMSLLKEVNRISPSLLLILKWLHISPNDEFKDFLHDARRFIRSFGVPIAQSAPHLYISALPFAPENSSVAKHFLPHFPWILALSRGKPTDWPPCIFTSELHRGSVNRVAFSADEEYFVTGSNDATLCIFDSETGNLRSGPFECDGWVCSVFFDPNGHYVGAICRDGRVVCWDIGTGNEHLVIRPQASLLHFNPSYFDCCFSDSKKIISAGETITLWNGETGTCEQNCDWTQEVYGKPRFSSISPDGRYVARTIGEHPWTIRIWEVVDGSTIQGPLHSHPHFGHLEPISALSFSVDSRFAVSGSADGTILIWNASTGETAGPPLSSGAGEVLAVAYSPKNHLLASTSSMVTIWDAVSHEVLGRLSGHTSAVIDIALSQDGQRVLTASWDRTVRMWDLSRKGDMLGTNANQTHMSEVRAVAFSQCGKKLASLDRYSIQGWDANTGKSLFKFNTGTVYEKLIFSPDGSQVVAYHDWRYRGSIRVWDVDSGALVFHLNLSDDADGKECGPINHVAFRSTDGVLVLGSDNGIVLIIKNGVPHKVAKLPYIIALSPDGLTAIVLDEYSTPRHYVWSTTTHRPLPLVLTDGYYTPSTKATYSTNGRFFAAKDVHGIQVWNMRTGGLVTERSITHRVDALVFLPDNRHIASLDSGAFHISNIRTGRLTSGPWNYHTGKVTTLAFSPDGKLLASGAEDRQVRLWNVANMLEDSQLSLSNWGVGTRMEDGWVKDVEGKLVFWVPKDHRTRLIWPHSVPLSDIETTTELDPSRFKYGESWAECYSGGNSSGRAAD